MRPRVNLDSSFSPYRSPNPRHSILVHLARPATTATINRGPPRTFRAQSSTARYLAHFPKPNSPHPSSQPQPHRTPYAACSSKYEKLLSALRPAVTWNAIESALSEAADLDGLVPALASLSPNPEHLRLPDLLFCEHEGAEEVLAGRRRKLWDLLLDLMTCDLCTKRALSKFEHAFFEYGWAASMGPSLSMTPGLHNQRIAKTILAARATYREDMERKLLVVAKAFEDEARPFYEALLKDVHGAILASLSEKTLRVKRPKEMTHNRMLKTPAWAQRRDLRGAMAELNRIGAIQSEGDLADLCQQGRHRLFGKKSEKAVFAKPGKLMFWMGAVTLWMIRLHELEEEKFNTRMRGFAEEGEYSQVGAWVLYRARACRVHTSFSV